jgi:pyridoxal phosphate enzyme (YggS family)
VVEAEILVEAISDNLAALRTRIDRSARASGYDPDHIALVCVSKSQPSAVIDVALASGERVFGENRVQEALSKWPPLRARCPGVELHLIGPLQTNKVHEAVGLFDVIETLDRPKLADAIAKEFKGTPHRPKLFIQVNTGREAQKAGILPEDADEFIAYCRKKCGLQIEGLMCIPPLNEQASPHFALLAMIARRNEIGSLSMGMSEDFELAIQLGATHVRVGSAIFGPRNIGHSAIAEPQT